MTSAQLSYQRLVLHEHIRHNEAGRASQRTGLALFIDVIARAITISYRTTLNGRVIVWPSIFIAT